MCGGKMMVTIYHRLEGSLCCHCGILHHHLGILHHHLLMLYHRLCMLHHRLCWMLHHHRLEGEPSITDHLSCHLLTSWLKHQSRQMSSDGVWHHGYRLTSSTVAYTREIHRLLARLAVDHIDGLRLRNTVNPCSTFLYSYWTVCVLVVSPLASGWSGLATQLAVPFVVGGIFELFVTFLTLKWALVGVDSGMFLQLWCSFKCFSTWRAFKWFCALV